MRVLVFGAGGWIGSKIVARFGAHNTIISGRARLGTFDGSVEREVDEHAPTHVVVCVGRTHGGSGAGGGTDASTIDFLELGGPERLRENLKDNLLAPIEAAHVCAARGIHMTYIGTGCIYTYEDTEGYSDRFTEASAPNFFGSSYSAVKGATDALIRMFDKTVLTLRIRMPVDDEMHPRNFITKITSYEKVIDVPNSLTVLPDLLPHMWDLMKRGVTGPLNFCNPGPMSHGRILAMYAATVDPTFEWTTFSIEEQDQVLKAKRSNCALDTTRLEALCPTVRSAEDAVMMCLHRIRDGGKGQ